MEKVYREEKDCCGCRGCMNICPMQAITMVKDKIGFEYPTIDPEKCIDCGKCLAVCPMNQTPEAPTEDAWACALNDKAIVNSASGGAFYALARTVIEKGGVVFGCAFDSELKAIHVEADSLEQLKALQGSKYVQSVMDCHLRVLELLKAGKTVLFSGTPCQTASIRSFAGRFGDKLYTVELVCHGVPSAELWKDYISYLGSKHKGQVSEFCFRFKNSDSVFTSRYTIRAGGKSRNYVMPSVLSYYYYYFLKGKIYRRSCYDCPFARAERQADLTICDYWGYAGQLLQGQTGISAILIQSKRGKSLFEASSEKMLIERTTPAAVAEHNEQLRKPMAANRYDEGIIQLWMNKGADGLEKHHRIEHWKAYLYYWIKKVWSK